MYCPKCGDPVDTGEKFCNKCGFNLDSNNQTQNNINNFQNNISQNVNNNYNQYSSPNITNGNVNMNNIQQPMQQPAWQNGYNSNPNFQPPKKSSGFGKYILIGLGIVVAIIVALVIIGSFAGNDNSNSGTSYNNNGSNKRSNSSYKVNFKGFTFNVPDNLVYEEDSGVLMIGDEGGTWLAQIEVEQGSFAQLKANKSKLQSLMQQSGYTSSIAQEKTISGVEFLTMEISMSGQNAIAALTKGNSMFFMAVTVMNLDNEFDYSLLETVAPIVSTATYSNSSTNMKSGAKLDMSGLSELAK